MPTVRDLSHVLETVAPPATAQSYDNVGLQLGDPDRDLTGVLTALDLVPAVVDEAVARHANCIVTHHPLIFRPIKRLTADDFAGRLLLRLAEAGIAYYACHTNIDAAAEGVSFALARTLGLEDVRFLGYEKGTTVKLVTFVPNEAFETVREALAGAGAGQIGAYEACAFAAEGTGFFRPTEAADPHIGHAGGPLERVAEWRLEVEVARWDVGRVIAALKAAHPYEEVAYDLMPVEQRARNVGLGAVGRLAVPELLPVFLRRLADRLDAGALRYVGRDDAQIETVAVCGGAGTDFLGLARRAGADAYVTADVTYHRFFEALAADGTPDLAFIDVGHYESEAMTEALLARLLAEAFPSLPIHRTRHRTSPVKAFP